MSNKKEYFMCGKVYLTEGGFRHFHAILTRNSGESADEMVKRVRLNAANVNDVSLDNIVITALNPL